MRYIQKIEVTGLDHRLIWSIKKRTEGGLLSFYLEQCMAMVSLSKLRMREKKSKRSMNSIFAHVKTR